MGKVRFKVDASARCAHYRICACESKRQFLLAKNQEANRRGWLATIVMQLSRDTTSEMRQLQLYCEVCSSQKHFHMIVCKTKPISKHKNRCMTKPVIKVPRFLSKMVPTQRAAYHSFIPFGGNLLTLNRLFPNSLAIDYFNCIGIHTQRSGARD